MGRLTYTDMLLIEKLRNQKWTITAIAACIGCCRKTIYAELKRGVYIKRNYDYTEQVAYSPEISLQKRAYAKTACGTEIKLTWTMAKWYSHALTLDGYSVKAAVGRARKLHLPTVSYTTLYRYIELGYIPGVSRTLVDRRKKVRYKKVAKRAPRGKSIERRPYYINNRNDFGHWELDSVVGRAEGIGESLIVLTERKTRYEIIEKIKRKTCECTIDALKSVHQKYGSIIKTLTVDNGCEFMDYQGMKRYAEEVYYCHPYASYERGSNENANRIIRRKIPKHTSMRSYTEEYIQSVQDWMNDMPREILGWRTAREAFEAECEKFFAKC